MDAVNLKKIDKMALLSFQNAARLHLDSILLFTNNSYASAYYLSMTSLEELGKIFLLTDFLWHSRVDGRYNSYKDPEMRKIFGNNIEEGYFKRIIFNHLQKQFHFVRTFDSDYKPRNKYFKQMLNGILQQKKQNSLYVGFRLNKNKIDMKGRINNPHKIAKNTVDYQISLVHRSLLELIICVSKEIWTTDSEYLDEYLNEEIYYELKTKWHISDKKFITRLNYIEKI
jgi:AbiV family abortive infection protein